MAKLIPTGKIDKYGVAEAQGRRDKQQEIAKGFANSPQNVWTKSAGNWANKKAKWAQTNLTNREGYQQNQTDFASWKNLDNYFNDTAGAFIGQGGSRKNKFGKKDVDYLTKVGVNQDVINAHVGGLDKSQVHQNYWNNDAAAHLHKDGWDSGHFFNKSDRQYVKDNNMDLLEQINAYGKRRSSVKGGTSHLDNESTKALQDAGQYQDYMKQFAQGHTKEAGINSYNREGSKNFIGADIRYLQSQGYSNEDITKFFASQKKNDKGEGKGVNHWAASWMNRNGMVDTYENYTAPPTPQSDAKERAQAQLAQSGKTVNNNQNNSVNESFNKSLSTTINNNQDKSVNDSNNRRLTTNNNQNNSVNDSNNRRLTTNNNQNNSVRDSNNRTTNNNQNNSVRDSNNSQRTMYDNRNQSVTDSNNSSSSLNYSPTSSRTTSNSNNSESAVNYDSTTTSNSNNRTQTNQQQNLLTANSNNVTDSGNFTPTINTDIKSGKTGNMTNTIGDNNDLTGTSFGNDNSVTITGGSDGAMDNMLALGAYHALNNNQFKRSQGELNGTGRSAQQLKMMDDRIGAKDTAKNAYNMAGMYQQYFNDSSKAMQASWAGDIFNFNAPSWMQGSTPSNPTDDTKNIFKNGMMQFS